MKGVNRLGLFIATAVPFTLDAGVVITSPEVSTTTPGTDSLPFLVGVPGGTGFTYTLNYSFGNGAKPQASAEGAATLSNDGAGALVKYSLGNTIDSTATWQSAGNLYKPATDTDPALGYFPPGTRGYLGLQIPNGGGFNYGWADVSHNADSTLTLHRFAVETDLNQPIAAGVVPEPSSAFAAALVAGSFAAFRARRRLMGRCADPN
ncbi:MAG TPA: hypothetical protein VMF06_11230 [Candidatus Limnocylindria bacterium]|nr:hypothetical protein [Candidatus Limnocylindria bacterium]